MKYHIFYVTIITKEGEAMTYKTGQKPGKGAYVCTNCGTKIVLDDYSDTLPPCPKCNNTSFTK